MLTTIQLKLIGLGFILLILLGCIASYVYRGHEINTLKNKVAIDQVVTTQQAATIKTDNKIAVVNDKVHAKLNKKTAATNNKHTKIKNKVDQNIRIIDDSYKKLPTPPTPAAAKVQEVQKDDKVSGVIIDGLWEQYCVDNTTDIHCTAK